MAEISIPITDELKIELEESGIDVPKVIQEAITSKLVEQQLSKSKVLQRALFEAVVHKSKLTEKGAQELSNTINQSMLKELKKQFPPV